MPSYWEKKHVHTTIEDAKGAHQETYIEGETIQWSEKRK